MVGLRLHIRYLVTAIAGTPEVFTGEFAQIHRVLNGLSTIQLQLTPEFNPFLVLVKYIYIIVYQYVYICIYIY